MKKIIFYAITFFSSTLLFAQVTEDDFSKGLTDGWSETLKSSGYGALANGGPKWNECEATFDNKGYKAGYRCGVQQASKLIPKLEQQAQEDAKNNYNQKVEEYNKEHGISKNNNSNTTSINLNSKQNNDADNSQRNERLKDVQSFNQKMIEQQQLSEQRYNQQYQSNMNQISNSMRSTANQMQAMMMQNQLKELQRRKDVTNNFITEHSNRLKKISNFYKQIQPKNFNQILNGTYNANIIFKQKFSFSNDNELQTVYDCKINVENNTIKNIYLFGKKGFELNYPKTNAENKLYNGFIKYYDVENFTETSVVVLEPYFKPNSNTTVSNNGTGYIVLWSNDKGDTGKKIYIQELDTRGNIISETATQIIYAKNSKEIEKDETAYKISINTNNNLLYFGEITNTPFGRFPLYPKISKDNNKPLNDNEVRFVEVKKYRE